MDKMNEKVFQYGQHLEDSNISYKNIIKDKLLGNENILNMLDNEELKDHDPDDYYGVNFFPYYLLPETQVEVKNYICYETSFQEIPRYNTVMKLGQITFYILCDCSKENIMDASGSARHDILAGLITDDFNWCNDFGTQFKLVSDRPGAIDNNYISRVLVFEQTIPNSIVRNQSVINNVRVNKQ
jgi:hypothetical protein